jgi:hypothetical protein
MLDALRQAVSEYLIAQEAASQTLLGQPIGIDDPETPGGPGIAEDRSRE